MKKFKKSTAIALTVVFALIMVIGVLLSFVPMTFGANTFVSLSGSINISSDISGGMYGEYDIKSENATKTEILNSMKTIREIFEEDGYKNVNVYALGNSKIRVEVSYPRGGDHFSETYSELVNVGSGAFSLRSSSTINENTVIVDGKTCVEEVKVFTNNSAKYISIVFNEKGQEQYKKLCTASQTVYMVFGDSQPQSISAAGVTDYTSFTLSDTDYSNLVTLKQRVKLGCLDIEINGETAVVNTMSASLSAGESASSPVVGSFKTSVAYVIAITSIFIVIALGLAAFAARFGLYSVLMAFTLLINIFLFLGLFCLMPSAELGLSGAAAICLGLAVIYVYAYIFASRVKFEYNQGKSLAASIQTAYKKLLPATLIENIVLFLSSIIFFFFSFGELTSFAIIFAICSFLSLFTNLLLIPLLIKIAISFNGFGTKLFMLKKRDISIEAAIAENEAKIEEGN